MEKEEEERRGQSLTAVLAMTAKETLHVQGQCTSGTFSADLPPFLQQLMEWVGAFRPCWLLCSSIWLARVKPETGHDCLPGLIQQDSSDGLRPLQH